MDRRRFLRHLGAAGLASAGLTLNPGGGSLLRFARGASGGGKTLVVVFQRGGCDGLNVVVPHGDPDYARHRPTIAIPPPGAATRAALDLDGFFGLHPSLAGLYQLYLDGQLAVFPAVHYPDAPRSHFDSERLIEGASLTQRFDGWLNRLLTVSPGDGLFRAVGVGARLPFSLFGDRSVLSFDKLDVSLGAPATREPAIRDALRTLFATPPNGLDNRDRVAQSGALAMGMLDSLGVIGAEDYAPQYGAEYPDDGFGRHLSNVARLIKSGVGVELAAVDIGGWDTHSGQGGAQADGRQAGRLALFDAGLSAFMRDLSDYRDDVLVLTMTEFGRTVQENGSGGTDHGKASAWFALGGAVRGGVHGDWPGLDEAMLDAGRFLRYTIDYRNIFADVLERHLGLADAGSVVQDLGGARAPVGFL